MMDAHPEVCGPFPKHLVNPLARNLFRYGDLNNEANWRILIEDVYRLLAAPFSEWRHRFSMDELLNMADVGDAGGLIHAIFAAEAVVSRKSRIFVKENQIYEYLPFLMHEFPAARYLFLIRDPRDMALSWKRSPIHPGGVVRAAQQWLRDQKEALKHAWVLSKKQQIILVRYEDLISDTETELRRICVFFSLPYDEAMLEFHRDSLARKNIDGMQTWQNLTRTVLHDNKEKFRQHLSDIEVAAIEHLCKLEMSILGYPIMSSPSILENFDDDAIQRLAIEEEKAKDHMPPERVRENMSAKKAFYQHAAPLPLWGDR